MQKDRCTIKDILKLIRQARTEKDAENVIEVYKGFASQPQSDTKCNEITKIGIVYLIDNNFNIVDALNIKALFRPFFKEEADACLSRE